MSFTQFLVYPYFILLIVGIMVPSDAQHGIFSLKSLSFLGTVASTGLYFFCRQKVNASQLKLLSFGAISVSVLLIWFFVSLYHEQTTSTAQLDQFKLFLITLLVPLIALYFIKERALTHQQIFKTVIYAGFAYASLKVLLIALHLLHFLNIWTLIDALGIRYMRMGIYGNLDRFQTSVDIATPFLLFFVLQSSRFGLSFSSFFRYSFIIVSLLSTFLSFSRYLIFIYGISCLLYWFSVNSKRFVKIGFLYFIFCLAAFFAIGPEKVEKIVHRRIFSRSNFLSDHTRLIQTNALLEAHEETPFFGKGLGGYVPKLIRDRVLLHSYEVQWAAFLMQFGLFGIFFLMTPLLGIIWKLLEGPPSRLRYSTVALFILWLLSGFTNPFLISLTSGIIYALFCISCDFFSDPLKITLRNAEAQR